jgi:hypothetical protein
MSGGKQHRNFLNYYRCYNDGRQHHWQDIYPAKPDDDFPKCGATSIATAIRACRTGCSTGLLMLRCQPRRK